MEEPTRHSCWRIPDISDEGTAKDPATRPEKIQELWEEYQHRGHCPACARVRTFLLRHPQMPEDLARELLTRRVEAELLDNPSIPLLALKDTTLLLVLILLTAKIGIDARPPAAWYAQAVIERQEIFSEEWSLRKKIKTHFRQMCADPRIPNEWLAANNGQRALGILKLLSVKENGKPGTQNATIEAWRPFVERFPDPNPFLESDPREGHDPENAWPSAFSRLYRRPWSIPDGWTHVDAFEYFSDITEHLVDDATRLEEVFDTEALRLFRETVRFNAALLYGADKDWRPFLAAVFPEIPKDPPSWLPDLTELSDNCGSCTAGTMGWEFAYRIVGLYSKTEHGRDLLRKYIRAHLSGRLVMDDDVRYASEMAMRVSPAFAASIREDIATLAPEAAAWERIRRRLADCPWKTWIHFSRNSYFEGDFEIGMDAGPDQHRTWSSAADRDSILALAEATSAFDMETPWATWKETLDTHMAFGSWWD